MLLFCIIRKEAQGNLGFFYEKNYCHPRKIKKIKSLYRPALFEHSQNSLKGMFL